MTTLPSRKVTASFIGVFVIGVAVGALMLWCFTDTKISHFMSNTTDPTSMVKRINLKYSNDYQLTAEEQARIEPLTNEMAQHLYQLRHQFGVDVIATLDEYHQKIGAQMTPEQRAAYEKDNADRKARMTSLLLPDSTPPDQGQK